MAPTSTGSPDGPGPPRCETRVRARLEGESVSGTVTPEADPSAGHVLIIEDDATMRRLETISLQRAGWAVSEASTGREGVAVAVAALPEVIICDRMLPDLDGIEVIAALARDPSTASIPVVLVTGMDGPDDIVRGIEAGAHDYVVKPFRMIELEVRCRAALRVSRQHRRLARSEHELRVLSDNTTDLVVRCGLDGLLRYVSPSAGPLLGWDPAELVGRPTREWCHPDDLVPLDAPMGAPPGEVVSATRRVLRADGSYLWVDWRAQLIHGPRGDLEVLSTGRDATERVALAAALAESAAAYRRIVDLAAEGIWVVDPDLRTTFANTRMGEILGVPASEMVGRLTTEFMDDEGRAIAAAHMELVRVGIAESVDIRFVRHNGTPAWTSFNAAPIIDDHGVFQGTIALVCDVTDRHLHEEALARSEARYRTLLDHLPDTIALVVDRQMRTVVAAGADLLVRGLADPDLVGKRMEEFAAAEDVPFLEGIYRAAFGGEATTTEFRSQTTGVDNLLDVVPIVVSGGGAPAEILVISRDIGPRKDRERALAAAEARWRTAFQLAPVGMAQIGVDGRFVDVNPALCDMLGYSAERLHAIRAVDISHPDDVSIASQAIADLAADNIQRFRVEKRYIHARGHIVWCAVSAVPVHDTDGRVDYLLVHFLDISQLKRVESELQNLAVHDSLTGLLNRRGFDEALARHVAHVTRYGPDGALMSLDIDGLKLINDSQGHQAGDRAIATVAHVLRHRLRRTDTIARVGGDEFVVIVPHIDRQQACEIAAELVETIRRESAADDPGRAVTASVGITMFDATGRCGRDVLADADCTMYAAKRAGRDRYAIFSPSSREPEAA